MTQPSFVPIAEADQVRPARSLSVPSAWVASRPAELRTPHRPGGRGLGTPGPDSGFALRLARRCAGELRLGPGEDVDDVVTACALVGARRAALTGRAPCVHDVRLAFAIFGLAAPLDAGMAADRADAFRGAAHDYVVQRALVERIPKSTLLLSPDDGRRLAAGGGWRELVGLGARGGARAGAGSSAPT